MPDEKTLQPIQVNDSSFQLTDQDRLKPHVTSKIYDLGKLLPPETNDPRVLNNCAVAAMWLQGSQDEKKEARQKAKAWIKQAERAAKDDPILKPVITTNRSVIDSFPLDGGEPHPFPLLSIPMPKPIPMRKLDKILSSLSSLFRPKKD